MMSLNAVDEKNDIEDGSAGPQFLKLSSNTTHGILADTSNNGHEEGDPDFQNVSVFLDANPMKKDGAVVADRRPSVQNEQEVQHYTFFQRWMQSWGLAASPLQIERRERYREMLEEMRTTGTLKGNRAIDTAVANPKFLKMLEKYDTNGDGVIDAEEMTVMLNDFKSQKQQSNVLKKVVAGAFLFLIALLICNTFLTLWVIKLTQEVYVDDDTTSMVNSHNEMLKTDKPKFYTSISDLTMLPASALDSITRMTFTTIDGGVYNLLVNGVRMDATAEKSVDIFFTSNKRMHISGNNTAIFMDYDVADGIPTEVAVVLNVNDPLSTLSQSTARRLMSADATVGFTGSGSISTTHGASDRCFSSGVCLYTYDEMMSLFDEHAAAEGRRLQSGSTSTPGSASTMTYTEITADAKILTKDDRAGLSRAQGFLSALLQAQEDLKNGTLRVSFIMNDLCANYPTLRDDCRSYPAPSVVRPVNSSNLLDRRPFKGTLAEDGLWMFQDEIEYLLDAYSVQVKVRYAHDPLRDTRRHVVLMDLKNPSKMVTYDEVTIQYDPKNPTFQLESAQIFITNYNASTAVKSDGTDTFLDGGVDVDQTRRRRRLMAHDVLLSHVRSKITGFPSIDIPEEMLTSASSLFHEHEKGSLFPMDEVNRRLNAVGSSRNITVDVEESDDGYCVTTVTDENGNFLPCKSDVNGLSMQYPKSYFSNVWIGTLAGSITWPTASTIYSIDEYESVEIVYRSDLKALLDLQSYTNKTSTRRSLLSYSPDLVMTLTDSQQRMRVMHHINKRDEHIGQINERFRAFDQVLQSIIDRADERHRRRLLSSDDVTTAQRRLNAASVKPYKDNAIKTQSTVQQFYTHKISDEQKDKMKDKITQTLYGQIQGYMTDITNSVLNNVPMRKGSTCSEFHGLMSKVLQNIADLNDVIVKIIEYSDNINETLDAIEDLRNILRDLITVNDALKPVIPAVGKIPYAGPVAKAFQAGYNSVVTNPVTPAKNVVDKIQAKIVQYKLKERNQRFLTTAQNISNIINTFISDATIMGDVLLTVDNACIWTPTTVNGVVTYNFTVTGQTCSTLNIVLRQVLTNINLMKSKADLVLGQIQQLSNLVDSVASFMKTFDRTMINAIQTGFNAMNSFLNKKISLCIPWVCFDEDEECSDIRYPCGVKRCKTRFGRVPCGVKRCTDEVCVKVVRPYSCNQCAEFSAYQVINGAMSVADQLESAMTKQMDNLAKALGITLPQPTIPGLPSVDFLAGVESTLTDLFNDILQISTLVKDFNSVRSRAKTFVTSVVCQL